MRTATVSCMIAAVALASADAGAFVIGVSARGGLGSGYYSMDRLNGHINIVRQRINANFDELGSGTNFHFAARMWFFDRFAASAGYEHFYGESALEAEEFTINYKVPADVYMFGGVVRALKVPEVIDLNAGFNYIFARGVYQTSEYTGGFTIQEFKGNESGFELYGEVVTNFILPVEVGFQLGYRGLKIKSYENKFGDPVLLDEQELLRAEIDYSGAFFYITAGVRL